MSQTAGTRWTNTSVVGFAKGADPIEAIERYAREITLKALDKGWSGPPFDPIKLADVLGIPVNARFDISDARTVPSGRKGFIIEFNPTRSRGRVRFSIAHEIAHTFFPDCANRARNRGHEGNQPSDNWQLELLCNVAAAELIMPIGSLEGIQEADITIEKILALRQQYDVSAEAILIRITKVSSSPFAVFCASRIESGIHQGSYRIDYVFSSRSWNHNVLAGTIIPADSVVHQCTAIGYTAKGQEKWGAAKDRFAVECVGLPRYPGTSYPRVAGILRSNKQGQLGPGGILYVHGDALTPRGTGCKIIAQIVNDKTPNWGGAGFASAVRRRYSAVQNDFQHWAAEARGRLALGKHHLSKVNEDLYVFNMIAQHGFGDAPAPRIRYHALEACLEALAPLAKDLRATIHMPRIGTGHAGGNWSIIEELLAEKLVRFGLSTTVYDLPSRVSAGPWGEQLMG